MTEIKHPTLPVSRQVPDSRVADWLATGWLLARPPVVVEPEPAEAVEDAPKPSRRRKAD